MSLFSWSDLFRDLFYAALAIELKPLRLLKIANNIFVYWLDELGTGHLTIIVGTGMGGRASANKKCLHGRAFDTFLPTPEIQNVGDFFWGLEFLLYYNTTFNACQSVNVGDCCKMWERGRSSENV